MKSKSQTSNRVTIIAAMAGLAMTTSVVAWGHQPYGSLQSHWEESIPRDEHGYTYYDGQMKFSNLEILPQDEEILKAGACRINHDDPESGTCVLKYTNCDGEYIDVEEDSRHCGACGFSCGKGETCERGICVEAVVCVPDCDDCLRNPHLECRCDTVRCNYVLEGAINEDTNPGGKVDSCGNSCVGDESCLNGQCILECNVPQEKDCDNDRLCENLVNDPTNCGQCGVVCTASQICYQKQCITPKGGVVYWLGSSLVDIALPEISRCTVMHDDSRHRWGLICFD